MDVGKFGLGPVAEQIMQVHAAWWVASSRLHSRLAAPWTKDSIETYGHPSLPARRPGKLRNRGETPGVAWLLSIAGLALAAGCGSYSGESSDRAPDYYGGAAPAEAAAEPADRGGYTEEAESRREYAAASDSPSPQPASAPPSRAVPPQAQYAKKAAYSGSASGGALSSGPAQRPQEQAQQVSNGRDINGRDIKGERKIEQPLVVYFGYLKLRVRRQIEAFDDITKLAQAAGGYVQSLSGRTVVVRVPATDFDAAMARFGAVGEVLSRQVKAMDVSRQFTDMQGRLLVAQQARARLLQLLEKVKNTDERLQILEEIKRLSEAIETAESSLATLRNLADFFTITIDIEPVVADGVHSVHRSPFPWIRDLTPHLVTLTEGKKGVAMDMPKGFVLFAEDDVFRAQSADTSLLRVGRVTNEPVGDAKFWSLALQHEMEGRDEELVEERTVGGLQVRVWRNKDVRPRYYLVGATVAGDHVYVIEVFLPNDAAWSLHKDGLWKALGTLEVKP